MKSDYIPSHYSLFVIKRFLDDDTPLLIASSSHVLLGVLIVYVSYVLINWGKTREPRIPRLLLIVYNALMSLLSAALFASLFHAIIQSREHIWELACTRASHEFTRLYALSYVLRLVEFTDSVFIVHSSRPLTFLHVFHHGATLALAHLQIIDSTGFQFLTLLVNAAVHALMYAFYATTAFLCRTPSWKRAVTLLQLVQFALLLIVYGLTMPAWWRRECEATERSVYAAFAVLLAYFVLFARFYKRTYT